MRFTDPKGLNPAAGAVVIGGGVMIIGGVINMSGPSGQKAIKSIAQKVRDLCMPDDSDPCEQQYEEDESDCYRNYGDVFGYGHFSFQGCMQNAKTRREQCKKGQPQIPKWGDGHVSGQPPISPRGKK